MARDVGHQGFGEAPRPQRVVEQPLADLAPDPLADAGDERLLMVLAGLSGLLLGRKREWQCVRLRVAAVRVVYADEHDVCVRALGRHRDRLADVRRQHGPRLAAEPALCSQIVGQRRLELGTRFAAHHLHPGAARHYLGEFGPRGRR